LGIRDDLVTNNSLGKANHKFVVYHNQFLGPQVDTGIPKQPRQAPSPLVTADNISRRTSQSGSIRQIDTTRSTFQTEHGECPGYVRETPEAFLLTPEMPIPLSLKLPRVVSPHETSFIHYSQKHQSKLSSQMNGQPFSSMNQAQVKIEDACHEKAEIDKCKNLDTYLKRPISSIKLDLREISLFSTQKNASRL